MKRTALFGLSVIITMVLMCASAKANGLTTTGGDGNSNWYAAMDKMNGYYSLYGSMSTRLGAIDYVSTRYYTSVTSPASVSLYLYIGGRMGTDPSDTMAGSQSLSTLLNGTTMNQSVYTDFYDASSNGKGIVAASSPRMPEFWASGSGDFSFASAGVQYVSGSANYSTYDSYMNGKFYATYFDFSPSWTITFFDSKAAADFGAGLASMGVTAVPEPGTISIVALSVFGLVARRCRK